MKIVHLQDPKESKAVNALYHAINDAIEEVGEQHHLSYAMLLGALACISDDIASTRRKK